MIPQWKPVNTIFEDAAFYCTPPEQALFPHFLIDCGELHNLTLKELNKVEWVFISHFHIDHVIGLDHLIRIQLGQAKTLHIAGPPGTGAHVYHRLQGYLWNLVDDSPYYIYTYDLHPKHIEQHILPCSSRFTLSNPTRLNQLPLAKDLKVNWVQVEHKGPCLAYQWTYTPKPRVNKTTLATMTAGAWLGSWIKNYPERPSGEPPSPWESWAQLEEALIIPPQPSQLTYVTDTRLDQEVRNQLEGAFNQTNTLICEAAFLDEHYEKAKTHAHATVSEAAHLAKKLNSSQTALVHLSPRYASAEEHQQSFKQQEPDCKVFIPDPPQNYPWR